MNAEQRDQEILALTQAMLNSVVGGDWNTYANFCSEDISCFEAETEGVMVEGLAFHHFYFRDGDGSGSSSASTAASANGGKSPQVTMARPHLRWISDDAVVISYTRLTQRWNNEAPVTSSCCETRIWQRKADRWIQVHIHRS